MFSYIKDITRGEPITAERMNQMRDEGASRDIGSGYRGIPGGGYHPRTVKPEESWFEFQAGDSTVPAYGVGVITEHAIIGGIPFPVVNMVSEQDSLVHVVNGPYDVESGTFGKCTLAKTRPVLARCDGETISPLQKLSVKSGTFFLEEGEHLIAVSESTDDKVWVVSADTGGGDGDSIRWGELVTDLYQGETCQIQEYTQDVLGQWCNAGSLYTAHHPPGELEGTAGLAVVAFYLNEEDEAIIVTITCPDFFAQLCSGVS